ncbi:MAG TPA: hypothetical protein VGA73_18275 [Candidatus Binatia bacterium]
MALTYEASKRASSEAPDSKLVKMTIYLTPEAQERLEHLQFKLLDGAGNKPSGSEIVECLLRTAVKKEKLPLYPAKRS